jgi:serine/threonine protein phosphatase 1
MLRRTFVVGDIHGCVDELDVLLSGIGLVAEDRLVFVGDYIDRGPDSRGVVDRLLALDAEPGRECTFLRGNHEDMLLAYLGRGGHYGEAFLANGGDATAESYGVYDPTPAELLAALPDAHLRFFEGTRLLHVEGGYVVVHAGIRPALGLDRQSPHDLLWIRDEFIRSPHALGRTVIFGHTPGRTVLVDLPYKIGIDTGCVYGGMLTALELSSCTLHSVRRGAATVGRYPLPA